MGVAEWVRVSGVTKTADDVNERSNMMSNRMVNMQAKMGGNAYTSEES